MIHPTFYLPGSLETWLRLGSRARRLMKRFDSGEITREQRIEARNALAAMLVRGDRIQPDERLAVNRYIAGMLTSTCTARF